MEVYKAFQILMGIILSVFILFMLINYSGSYAGVQQTLNKATVMKNFITDSRSVYFSGNSINFTDFTAFDFSNCKVDSTGEPHMVCVDGEDEMRSESLLMPIFFNTDEEVVISRNVVDMGWWKFYYITAPSRKRILLNPLETDDGTWGLMEDVVAHLPDTERFTPKTTYGFCDGSQKLESLCYGSFCERGGFQSLLGQSHSGMDFSLCTSALGNTYRLIVLSENCAPGMLDGGICVTPLVDGAGRIVFLKTGREYVYTDMADVAAAVIGEDTEDAFGRTGGERLLEYKRKIFLRMVGTAADEMIARSDLIIRELPDNGVECKKAYLSFMDSLRVVSAASKLDLDAAGNAETLASGLEDAGNNWTDLKNKGCESAS